MNEISCGSPMGARALTAACAPHPDPLQRSSCGCSWLSSAVVYMLRLWLVRVGCRARCGVFYMPRAALSWRGGSVASHRFYVTAARRRCEWLVSCFHWPCRGCLQVCGEYFACGGQCCQHTLPLFWTGQLLPCRSHAACACGAEMVGPCVDCRCGVECVGGSEVRAGACLPAVR